MLNKVETGPANEKIVKNDGSCATNFFFFFVCNILVFKKRKKKKKKGLTKLIKNMVWFFPNFLILGKDGWGISFFFGIRYTPNSDLPPKKKKKKKKKFLTNRISFFYFKFLIFWMNVYLKYYQFSFFLFHSIF